MRAVLDTVILVRSLLDSFGRSGAIVFGRANEYEAIVSTDIVAEYLDVLNRPSLSRRFREADSRNLDAVHLFINRATVVQPIQIAKVCRDPEDDYSAVRNMCHSERQRGISRLLERACHCAEIPPSSE